MRNIVISLSVIAVIIGGVTFAGINKSDTTNRHNQLKISLEQINKNQKDGAIIVDVRTAKEYNINHAVDAVNIPVEDIKKGKLPTTDKNKIIYVYCRTGKRASDAKSFLISAGYTKVINLTSLKNWISLGGKSVNASGKECIVADEKSC